ncbi:MAG: M48 family metalloprotease [Paracoccaceae bacterium]
MLRFLPILLAVVIGLVMYTVSARRLRHALNAQSTALTDPALLAHCAVFQRELGLKSLPVRVYEVDMLNGLAAPDGRVFITRGFMKALKAGTYTSAELASVVAHELGHVGLGHARRRMVDFSAQNALRTTLMLLVGRFLPYIGIYVVNFLISLISARLSRQDEFEADSFATALMLRSGLGIGPQISLFEKLGKKGGNAAPAWLLSHPKAEQRIAAIREIANQS